MKSLKWNYIKDDINCCKAEIKIKKVTVDFTNFLLLKDVAPSQKK